MKVLWVARKQGLKNSLSRNTHAWQRRAVWLVAALMPLAILSGCAGTLNDVKPSQAAIQFTPSNLNFGSVIVGKKVSQTLSLKNTGATTLNIKEADLSGKQFTLSGITFPFSLVAGSTAKLTVSFSGSATGSVKGTLTLKTDAGAFSTAVALSADATPAQAQLSLNPASVSFGSVTTGTKASSDVIVTNSGGSDLNISMITVNGGEFSVAGVTTPKTISAGQSVTLSVSFAPTTTGAVSGSIAINSNDSQSPATISLSGTGTTNALGRLTLNPASLAFSNVTVGSSSVLSSTVTNSGQATVHVSQVNTTGSGFTVSGLASGAVIAAGQSAAIQVRFTPAAAGAANGSVSIVSDASGPSARLSLSGNGVSNTPPTVSIVTPVNGSTVSGTVTVSANASANAGVASVQFQLDGANVGSLGTAAPYSYSWDTTKSAKGNHVWVATAKDAAGNSATSASVTVTVNNSSPGTTKPSVPAGVSAMAASASQINLSWNASTSSAGVAGYFIYRGGSEVGTSLTTAYSDAGLNASTTYSYTVAAYDAAGNTSAPSSSVSATTLALPSGGALPSTLGWYQIPNTKMRPLCPPNTSAFAFSDNCQNVIDAWSGGIADTKRNRLLVWGGGHVDYYGNEIYSLDLNNLTMTRLNDPSPLDPGKTCVQALSDGKANTRHTYGGLSYIAHADKMYVFSGIVACQSGGGTNDTWTLGANDLSWKRQDPTTGNPPSLSIALSYSDYDPNTKNVFVDAVTSFYSYNYDTNTYTALNNNQNYITYHGSAVIDPGRKLFIIFGPNDGDPYGTLVYDISSGSNYQLQNWTSQTSGCSALQNASYPGLAYDPVQKVIVGWAGGNTVYQFNPDTKVCTAVTYPNGPAAAQPNGTNGRFRYFPALGVFALVNDVDQNAYVLRLTPGSGQALTDFNVAAGSVTSNSAVITWTTSASANSQVNYGTAAYYGSSTTLNSSMVTTHSQTLSGLSAGTTYHFQVVSEDGSGNTASSGDFTFTTTAPAAGVPVLSGVNVTATTASSATIMWTTDQSSSTNVAYGTSTSYGSNSGIDATLLTSHMATLTGLSASTLYHFQAQSANAMGNQGVSGDITFTTAAAGSGSGSTVSNTVTIYERSGAAQSNRPVSISRVFAQGDIPNFAQASIGGSLLLTQCDVKNRWPDGSVKFAIVSFVAPSLAANGSATVTFQDQATGNNIGYLVQSDMLNSKYDFESQIKMAGSNTQTVSARAMLSAGAFRYWLQGPIVTAVILEDRTPARSYDKDFGDGSRALHPIFEAWFYPQSQNAEVGASIENTWVSSTLSNSMRDLTYAPTITAGLSNPTTVFSQGSMVHIGASRWHKRYWVNGRPAAIHVDYNLPYMVQTRAIPNYETTLTIAPSLIAAKTTPLNGQETIDGTAAGIGRFQKNLAASGASDWIGLMNTWETVYLLSMDEGLRNETLGQADLAGRIPFHYREGDSNAGMGHFFDNNGSVDTFGRTVSVNARHQLTLAQINWRNDCSGTLGADDIAPGPVDNQTWVTSRDHIPSWGYVPYLMSGRYYYLEELEYEASFILASKLGCYGGNYARQGEAGYLNDSQLRGNAWSYRTLGYAAFMSPDGSAEKAYYEDKLMNNISKDQGTHSIANSDTSRLTHWTWGLINQRDGNGEAPLHFWMNGGPDFIENPLRTDGSLIGGSSPWEEGFFISSLGMIRDFGYPGADSILKFLPNRFYRLLLDPSVGNPYLIESYRYATKLSSTNNWVQDYGTYKNEFTSLPTGWKSGFPNETTDHSYGFIALTAVGFLYPYSADGYTGQQAWNWFKTNKPNQGDFATQSPKWDILPRK
jgi:hypothetical protein